MSHFFANKITIDKKEYVVGFVVREDGNGNRFYDHELTKIINPDWLVPGKQHEAAELRTNRDTARNTGIIIEILRDRLGVNDGTAQVLFQKQSPTLNAVGDVEKVINGQVRFNEGEGNYVVELFKTANLSTLAHEMGHAMHSYLSTKNQEPVDREYVIFVAEVASTCNESLLMQHLLKKTSDKKQRAYLINYFLEQFRTTLYRQTMFAEFELKMSELTAKGESVNAETATKVYHDLIDLYFGPDIIHDEYIDLEWARIPHFYYNFYVYQYATGFSAAIALSQKILSEGEPAVKAYKEKFLSAGCSKDPVSILKDAGVDMSTKKPVEQALALFNSLLDEMDELMK